MQKQELTNKLRKLKMEISDPKINSNLSKRKELATKISTLKRDLRAVTLEENVDIQKKLNPNANIKIETITVEEDFTKKQIDTYRYHSLFKRLNVKFIEDNCNFNIGDLVECEDKVGFIAEFVVYPDKVKRKVTGIYAKLYQRRKDGTKAKKMLRRTRLDTLGFPIEELIHITS